MTVPDGPRDVHLAIAVILTEQSFDFAKPQPHECSHSERGSCRFWKELEDQLHFVQRIRIRLLRLSGPRIIDAALQSGRSLIISSVTRPGFSGGPVISGRGRVIGITEEENIGENENRHPIAFFSAVPAWYSRMVAEAQHLAANAAEGALGAPQAMVAPPAPQEG